jgi:hypothetical protein
MNKKSNEWILELGIMIENNIKHLFHGAYHLIRTKFVELNSVDKLDEI